MDADRIFRFWCSPTSSRSGNDEEVLIFALGCFELVWLIECEAWFVIFKIRILTTPVRKQASGALEPGQHQKHYKQKADNDGPV